MTENPYLNIGHFSEVGRNKVWRHNEDIAIRTKTGDIAILELEDLEPVLAEMILVAEAATEIREQRIEREKLEREAFEQSQAVAAAAAEDRAALEALEAEPVEYIGLSKKDRRELEQLEQLEPGRYNAEDPPLEGPQ